jgi:glycosyltransferase involved in cell wall biosynthesis
MSNTTRASPSTDVNERPRTILHLGPDVNEPGGMASVIRAYQHARLEPWRVEAMATLSARSRPRWMLRLVTSAVAVACRRRADMTGIHCHTSERFDIVRTLLLLQIARLRHIPAIVTLHGAEFMDEVRRRPRLVRAMLSRADTVTALTPAVADAARELGARRVRLLPNPVTLRSAPEDLSRRTQVLFAGEIGRRKGVDTLVEAWRRLRPNIGFSLLLVGPPVDRALIASLPEGASYGGVLDADAMTTALEESCLAVLPSRAEAMPMFILEAIAAGVPVIGTDVGAVASVVGDAGVIVPAGDPDALADALDRVLSDPSRLEALGAAAQQRAVERFAPGIFEARVRDLYGEAFR